MIVVNWIGGIFGLFIVSWTTTALVVDVQIKQLNPGEHNVCPHEYLEEVVVKEPCLRAYTKYVRTRKAGCNGLLSTCTVREPKTVYYRTYRNVTRKRRQTEVECCPGWTQIPGETGCRKRNCSADLCHNGGSCIEATNENDQLCQCPSGFSGSVCQYDVNECLLNNANCHHECVNTIGSFYCRCFPGYQLNVNGRCVDIDECSGVENAGCSDKCVNTEGGFYCECNSGLQLAADGRTCIQENSCAIANGGCEQLCEEVNGHFLRCRCRAGYELGADKRMCHLIDPCKKTQCQQFCQNHNGQARCECFPGFQLAYDQKSCVELSDCPAEVRKRCDHGCARRNNNFVCTCLKGYAVGSNGHSCIPTRDFCAHELQYCEQDCLQQLDDFRCACRDGYELETDGRTCRDVNECANENAGCSQTCVNTIGSHECSCVSGFLLDNDGKTCVLLTNATALLRRKEALPTKMTEQDRFFYPRAPTTRRSSSGRVQRVLRTQEYHETTEDDQISLLPIDIREQRVCEYGRFGADCEYSCADCKNGGLCREDKSGCVCSAPGFMGTLCEERCPENYWGVMCENICSCQNGKCDPITGMCKCADGWIGEKCEFSCPFGSWGPNCSRNCDECKNGAPCNNTNGECICLNGWHGETCNEKCPEGTWGRNCSQSVVCNHGTVDEFGICRCAVGYRGKNCNRPCLKGYYGEKCSKLCSCTNGKICNPISGACPENEMSDAECFNGGKYDDSTGSCICLDGFIGPRCETSCEQNYYGKGCRQLSSCQNGGVVDPKTGKCRCAPGWTNSNCTDTCPKGRWGSSCKEKCQCASDTQCNPVNGACICGLGKTGPTCQQTCEHGKYGMNCENDCECEGGASCHAMNGCCNCPANRYGPRCQHECPKGFYGYYCTKRCLCMNDGECSTDGNCLCKPGYFGDRCQFQCTNNTYGPACSLKCECGEHACHHISGACSCPSGFYFSKNKCLPCKAGKFGINCKQTCECFNAGRCDKKTGSCKCSPNYSGPTCNIERSSDPENSATRGDLPDYIRF